jgi:RimJ/RimL family protein N-acetyltransferase
MTETQVKDVFNDLPTLQTDRLLLRRLGADDPEDIFEYASDPKVAKYTSWPAHATVEDSREFLNHTLALYRNGEVAPWGVVCDGRWWAPVAFLTGILTARVRRSARPYPASIGGRD